MKDQEAIERDERMAEKAQELEDEMMEWVEGRRSWTNSIINEGGSNQYEIIMADSAHVQMLSSAILALRSGL